MELPKINFTIPTLENETLPLTLYKWYPERKFKYVSDVLEDPRVKAVFETCNIIVLYSKKNKGKSTVGYALMQDFFNKNLGNMVYGRLQEKEKLNAIDEITIACEEIGMLPFKKRGLSKDYLFFENSEHHIRFVNISSYQSLRGAIGTDNKFIWIDEINAHRFPLNFAEDFPNIISTLGRNNNFRLLMTGNNETAINNPVLQALQLKFNWSYTGLQICLRSIGGLKIAGIQLGADCFDEEGVPKHIGELLASIGNPEIYEQYYKGISNTTGLEQIVTVREDFEIKKPILYIAVDSVLFKLCKASVHELENGIKKDNAFVIMKELCKEKELDKNVKIYAVDGKAYTTFSNAVYLADETLITVFNEQAERLKKKVLFYGDFDTFEILDDKFAYASEVYQKNNGIGVTIDKKLLRGI